MMSFYDSLNFTNLSLIFNYSAFPNGSCYDLNGSLVHCDLQLDDEFVIYISSAEIAIIVFLSSFILSVIIGNVFVILAVALFRDMRTLTNGLIVSLASADLLVAIVVLPISLYNEVVGQWTLGGIVCDIWITADVFCCTASILNIVVIAVDRYWLITRNVRYTHGTRFARNRVCIFMVFMAWGGSAIISLTPFLGWRTGDEKDETKCMISQDTGYTVFSTFGAFWFPLGVILIVYFKIFRVARRRALTRAKARAVHPSLNSTMMSEMQNGKATRYSKPSEQIDDDSQPDSPLRTGNGSGREAAGSGLEAAGGSVREGAGSEKAGSDNPGSEKAGSDNIVSDKAGSVKEVAATNEQDKIVTGSERRQVNGERPHGITQHIKNNSARRHHDNSSTRRLDNNSTRQYESAGSAKGSAKGSGSRYAKSRGRRWRREAASRRVMRFRGRIRSSARTLGLIIGGFVLCWLPFFLIATVMPFCKYCQQNFHPIAGSVALWLGYSNSLLNPAIYAIWDKNFRRSFKRLATCSVRCDHIL